MLFSPFIYHLQLLQISWMFTPFFFPSYVREAWAYYKISLLMIDINFRLLFPKKKMIISHAWTCAESDFDLVLGDSFEDWLTRRCRTLGRQGPHSFSAWHRNNTSILSLSLRLSVTFWSKRWKNHPSCLNEKKTQLRLLFLLSFFLSLLVNILTKFFDHNLVNPY